MLFLIESVLLFLLIFSLVACGYYYLLLVVHLFHNCNISNIEHEPNVWHRIAIVIPAHNESECILQTLHSCISSDYPKEKFQLVVIADNCQDNTANIARQAGIRVLERFDDHNKGKGFALAFAFSVLLKEHFDAFLVIDADCTIDKQALLALNAALVRGYGAAQLNNVVANPDSSSMTYALAVGNYLENMFFYSPKSRIGWAVLLRGTGMLLTREALLTVPWQAYSVTEDVEYGMKLLQMGLRVVFIENARVLSPFPVDRLQLQVQRTRWASGTLIFSRKEAVKTIIKGLWKQHWLTIDSGLTFLMVSKPLLLLCSGGSLLLAIGCFLYQPSSVTVILLSGTTINFGLILLYFLIGIFLFGMTKSRWKLLLQAPETIFRLMWITVQALFGRPEKEWNKTPR